MDATGSAEGVGAAGTGTGGAGTDGVGCRGAGTARARVASEAAEKGDPGPFLHQGAALMQEGRFEAARKEFKKAVDVAPARGEAYNGVGVTFAMRQDYDAAIDWYKKGLEAAPGFGDLYYNLACAYSRQDKASMAVRR